jgi:hypothetical protein
MTARASNTAADMARALKALADAGLTVREVIMKGGEARLVLADRKDMPQGPRPKEWPQG